MIVLVIHLWIGLIVWIDDRQPIKPLCVNAVSLVTGDAQSSSLEVLCIFWCTIATLFNQVLTDYGGRVNACWESFLLHNIGHHGACCLPVCPHPAHHLVCEPDTCGQSTMQKRTMLSIVFLCVLILLITLCVSLTLVASLLCRREPCFPYPVPAKYYDSAESLWRDDDSEVWSSAALLECALSNSFLCNMHRNLLKGTIWSSRLVWWSIERC